MSARAFLVHEDAHLLVFDKPSGLAVQGGAGVQESLEDLLAAFAKSNGKRPRLVHRLDRETSGIILAARTKPAAAFLSAAFAERRMRKSYLAIVCGGAPSPDEGAIDLPLLKETRGGLDIARVNASGQTALTRYRTLGRMCAAALIEAAPETGRMHQIRAHLAALGRPIAGDAKYGGLFTIGAASIPRLMLHAARLAGPHPGGGTFDYCAPPPPDFAAACAALQLDLAADAPGGV